MKIYCDKLPKNVGYWSITNSYYSIDYKLQFIPRPWYKFWAPKYEIKGLKL